MINTFQNNGLDLDLRFLKGNTQWTQGQKYLLTPNKFPKEGLVPIDSFCPSHLVSLLAERGNSVKIESYFKIYHENVGEKLNAELQTMKQNHQIIYV